MNGNIKKSFTLIELIVVIAIIAILAAIIAPNAFKAIEKAKISQAISDFKTYKDAFYTYYADTGVWPIVGTAPLVGEVPTSWIPITDNGFITNVKSLSGWDGPYLEKLKPMHSWAGVYGLDCYNRREGSACDVGLFFEDTCYPYPNTDHSCDVPHKVMLKIDQTVDDGNLSLASGGNVWKVDTAGGRTNLYWILVWDAGCTDSSIQ